MKRVLALVVAAFVVPACGPGGTEVEVTLNDGTGETELFADDFSGTFPGTKWTIGAGSPAVGGSVGAPSPSLGLLQNGDAVFSTATFAAGTALTFVLDVGTPYHGAETDITSQGIFKIYDVADGMNFVALMAWYRNTGAVTFYIKDSGGMTSGAGSAIADNDFHRFKFAVDAAGNAAWSRDGVVEFTAAGFPAVELGMELYSAAAAPPYNQYFFDNVRVTSP